VLDNEISLQGNNARDRATPEGITDTRLRLPRYNDSKRAYRQRSCASFAVEPVEHVTIEDSAIFEGKEFTNFARRISQIEEAILGSAFMG
jgi:hypothetical protein